MRNHSHIVRVFVGATALTTLVAACEEETPPPKKVTVSAPTAPTPPKPEVRAEAPAPPTPPIAKTEPTPTKPVAPARIDEASDDDGDVAALVGKARDAINRGELDRALKLARLATKKAPSRSAAWNTLGRAQLKSGAKKDAIASFGKAVELNPSSSYAENNLGLALIYDGQYDKAVDALEDATALEPVEPYMWNNLGMAYEHLDRLDEAREAYKQAIAAAGDEDDGGSTAHVNLQRLAGVKSVKPVKTAKLDTVKSDVVPVDEVVKTDGGVK